MSDVTLFENEVRFISSSIVLRVSMIHWAHFSCLLWRLSRVNNVIEDNWCKCPCGDSRMVDAYRWHGSYDILHKLFFSLQYIYTSQHSVLDFEYFFFPKQKRRDYDTSIWNVINTLFSETYLLQLQCKVIDLLHVSFQIVEQQFSSGLMIFYMFPLKSLSNNFQVI